MRGTALLAGVALTACVAREPERRGAAKQAIAFGVPSTSIDDATVRVDNEGTFICSGTLIAPNVVVTARHCLGRYDSDGCGTMKREEPASSFSVAIGTDALEVPIRGRTVFRPPGRDLCGADIAILVLESPIPGARVATVRFRPLTTGDTTTAVGYGEDERGLLPGGRRRRDPVTVLAVGPTSASYTPDGGAAIPYDVPAGELAGSESICVGDSGGPLFDRDGALVAIAARGIDEECVDRPALFTTLAPHEALFQAALAAAMEIPEAGADAPAPPPKDGGSDRAPDASVADPVQALRGSGASCGLHAPPGSPVGLAIVLAAAAIARCRRRRRWG